MPPDQCPVCEDERAEVAFDSQGHDVFHVNCPRCGLFGISRDAARSDVGEYAERYLLSGAIRQKTERGLHPELSVSDLKSLLTEEPPPNDPYEAVDLYLNLVRSRAERMDSVVDLGPNDYPLLFAKDYEGMDYVIEKAEELGYVERVTDYHGRRLSLMGHERIGELSNQHTESRKALLSQKFGILRSEAQLELDFSSCVGDNGGLGLLFFDIDNFKAFNTKHTETVVDRSILIPFQHLLIDVIQSRGFAYSVGGDEFIILLRNVDPDEARSFAARLLDVVRKHRFPVDDEEETLTLSIGIGCYPIDAQTLPDLTEFANRAEKEAKQSGKNSIV